MLKNSANGILAPTMMALRRSPRNSHWIEKDQQAAENEIVQHGAVVTSTSEVRS